MNKCALKDMWNKFLVISGAISIFLLLLYLYIGFYNYIGEHYFTTITSRGFMETDWELVFLYVTFYPVVFCLGSLFVYIWYLEEVEKCEKKGKELK